MAASILFPAFGLVAALWQHAVRPVSGQIANAVVDFQRYLDGENNYEFIDVNGELASIIKKPYAIEILVTGLGFGEGPKWIQNCDYPNNGYILVADQFSHCIWKYHSLDGINYEIDCIGRLEGDQPNAIGWNLNYPDEIFVALQQGNAVVRLSLSQLEEDGHEVVELNRWTQSSEGYDLINVNDVVVDSKGNAYFTNFPFDETDASIVTGTWKISRDEYDNFEVTLLEQLNYGTNGIALNLEETLLVVASVMDFPAGEWAGGDPDQFNPDNVYFRGYTNFADVADDAEDTCTANMFYYLQATEAPSAFTAVNNGDGSAFDFDGNYWQSMIHGDTAEGYAVIVNPSKYGNSDDAIIGFVNFTDTGRGPTNFAKGMDGYMYLTLTQWNDGGWGTGGALARIKLKDFMTNDVDGMFNDQVLDCRTCKPLRGYKRCQSYKCKWRDSKGNLENPNCEDRNRWGCGECAHGFFREKDYIPCVACAGIDHCTGCDDFAGCQTCEPGYKPRWNADCGFKTCFSDNYKKW